MSQSEIELMGPETICSLRGRTGDGAMAETQRCDIVWNDGERTRGFLKCFSADHHLGVVNEITGYILSRACGLPVPKRAGIVALSQTLVDGLDIRGCPAGIYRYAFAISEAPGKTPNTLFDGLNDYAKAVLTRELLDGWHGLSPLLAFDDWSANQDRNLGNFLIDDKKSVYIIDHSNLPVDITWTADMLEAGRSDYANKLHLIMTLGGQIPLEGSFVVRAAEKHASVLSSVREELLTWWHAFLGKDPSRLAALEPFFQRRADHGPDRISRALSVMTV